MRHGDDEKGSDHEVCVVRRRGRASLGGGGAEIADLYELLELLTGSTVVPLNRAVAVAEAYGAERGLDLLTGLDAELPRHHLLPATRADLLARLGRMEEAVAEYGRVLELAGTTPEREFLRSRHNAARAALG